MGYKLQENKEDGWEWLLDNDRWVIFRCCLIDAIGGNHLTDSTRSTSNTMGSTINCQRKSTSLHEDQLYMGRLPSCLQLAIKGAPLNSVSCSKCGDSLETTDCGLISCPSSICLESNAYSLFFVTARTSH